MKLALSLLALALALAAVESPAQTLTWFTNRTQVVTMAAAQGKRILLLAGRPTCSNCEYMKETICEQTTPAIQPLISAEYIPWYCDIDQSSDWGAFASGLGSFSLPLICVIDPAQPATYLHRTTGIVMANSFYKVLYAQAAFTNAVITRIEPSEGTVVLALSNLTYGASVTIERTLDLEITNAWIALESFTASSKTTNWVDTSGDLTRAFYRASVIR